MVRKWSGCAWADSAVGTSNHLLHFFGTDSFHIWIVGDGEIIPLFNGITWSQQPPGSNNDLKGELD